jgi:N-acetylglucosamine-6-phosphate deacetylase
MKDGEFKSVLIRGARIVLPEGVTSGKSLLVQAGCIVRIDEESHRLRAEITKDCTGLTLYPGFVDLHIHGADGVDTMQATAADLRQVAKFLVKAGVTAWMPTLVPAPDIDYQSAVTAIEEVMLEQPQRQTDARIVGVHYEGPFVNSLQCGALRSAYFKSFSESTDIDGLPTPKDCGAIRMMTLAPEIDGGIRLVRELKERGWILALGHTRAEVDVMDEAFAAGARHLTHFMNAMPPLHHRAPGPVAWGLIKDEVTCDVIADGIHLDPLVLRLLLRKKGADRLALISDAIAAAGKGDGQYMIWGETIQVQGGRTRNANGNIAGSVITMADAVRMMLTLGASESEVALMASTNPARILGIDNECGSIAEGMRADLAGLDDKGKVRLTMVGGAIVFDDESGGSTNQ